MIRRSFSSQNATPDSSATLSVTRTVAYTDAVFAIAATILVLDLTGGALGEASSDAELWGKIGALWPNFLAFFISFTLLSMLWIAHVRQFRDIAHVDSTMLWLNNARLLFIVLIPFTTSLTSNFDDLAAGRLLFPLNFFLALLFGALSWSWAASRGGHLLRAGVADAGAQSLGGYVAVVVGALVVVLAWWVGSAAFLLFLVNEPITRVLQRRRARQAAGDASTSGG